MNEFNVLLVDDDQDVLDSYAHLMSIAGIPAKTLADPVQALPLVSEEWAGVAVIDMYMPQMHGMELLDRIKQTDAKIPVIVITGHGDIPMAVEAVKKGASDFLEKPINPPELLSLIKKHLAGRQAFIEQKQNLTRSIKREVIGKSAQMALIRNHIAQLALLGSHVLLVGESGVGRHTLAYLLHQLSDSDVLHEVNGTRLTSPEHVAEALTQAENGTLILTHADQMDLALQQQLSQLLLHQERLTGRAVRLIGIFSQQPQQLIQEQRLHPELYYLLSQGIIDVPPLRQRPDDIAALFHYYLKQSCAKLGNPLPDVEHAYLSCLRNHDWPGNIRELRNVAELYAIGIVKLTGQDRLHQQQSVQLDELVDDYEKQVIEDALFLFSGKVSEAAGYLQVPRKKLYLRMKKHGIEKDDFKSR